MSVQHGEIVAGVIRADRCLTGFHHIVDLVHDIAVDQTVLRFQFLQGAVPVSRIRGVDVDPQFIHGGAEGVAGIVELDDPSGVFLVPHQIPAVGVRLVDFVGVPDHADDAVGVGHGVRVVGIVVKPFEALVNVAVVGDVAEVQRQQHILLEHAGDHVVRRDDDVIAHGAGGELRIHILVGGVGIIVDGDAHAVRILIPFLEFLDRIVAVLATVGDVFTPVVDVQRKVLSPVPGTAGTAAGDQKDKHEAEHDNRDSSFHSFPVPLSLKKR